MCLRFCVRIGTQHGGHAEYCPRDFCVIRFAMPVSTLISLSSVALCGVVGVEVPMPYAANLEAAALPHVKDIVKAVKRVLNR